MKQKNAISSLMISLIFIFMTSCSLFGKRGAILNEGPIATKRKPLLETVPKEQYDQLAMKYSKLLKLSNPESSALQKKIEQKQLSASLERLNEETELAETVDVFSKKSKYKESDFKVDLQGINNINSNVNYNNLEKEISLLNKAKKLLTVRKYDESLSILKELELSKYRQISVRAKFNIGELLFTQSEFDLALQIFEEIVSKEAFSGVVLKTLGRMIVCAEKLGLQPKKEKYFSILHDFFESA